MMGRFPLGIARCGSYDADEVRNALYAATERAGGLPDISSCEVLIKANLLAPSPPEKAVTTHPEILRAIIGEIKDKKNGVQINVADNPGYIFTNAQALFNTTQVAALAEIEGVKLGMLSNLGVREVSREDFKTLSSARIANRYLDAGYCVNAAKLKTHVETEMTGCLKNIFGTADTATRKKAHQSVSQVHLANAITDLFLIRPPEFNILDAVVGMEGDGPSHGKAKHLGWILASRNALAADWAGAVIMGYRNPLDIPLIRAAAERGLGPSSQEDIELNGADWSELPAERFRKSSGSLRLLPTFLRGMAHNLVSLKPALNKPTCVRCWICQEVCPVDAIKKGEDSYPRIKSDMCVKCLCCHEMCPTGAMGVGKNPLAALLSRLRGE